MAQSVHQRLQPDQDSTEVEEQALRSEHDPRTLANIAEWREFLPADCVEAMIKDGWHRRV